MNILEWGKRVCGIFLLWATAAVALPAQTFTTVYNFCSQGGLNCTDGSKPLAGLLQAIDGNFYGTTFSGGADGTGTVFKISAGGMLTTLHTFDVTDGFGPLPLLVQEVDGNFYGTTFEGGANAAGTVFKITPSGTLTTLYNFCSLTNCTDGAYPFGLVQGTDGNFYGTTQDGGGASSSGTVFKIDPSGKLKTLHSFCLPGGTCTDGAFPEAALVQGTDGNFYGATSQGGAVCSQCGTVFKITPSGTFTTLHRFDVNDGNNPVAALVQGTDGNFYGTTFLGGANGAGTVFSITPSGRLTTLYSFCPLGGNCTDGAFPEGLLQGSDGNFYGTTVASSNSTSCPPSCGTIFKITPGGTLTTLYSFCTHRHARVCLDGADAVGALAEDTNGRLYGTAGIGGQEDFCIFGCGTVFVFSVGLAPIAETFPTFGPVGATVQIRGTDLIGATSVTFNGIAASFTVFSRGGMTATVPVGATTGTVQVVTPGGTLSSNVPFRVN